MSSRSANTIKKKYGLELPRSAKLRDEFWYVTKGARRGGLASYKKQGGRIGDPEIRLQKWRGWWEKIGRFKPHPIINVTHPVHKPKRSTELAEFVGIMMGDGGITDYQLRITLNRIDDKAYSEFVVKLIKKLFKLVPSIIHKPKDSVLDVTISRRELVRFCNEELGLVIGNKIRQQIDIPDWVQSKVQFQIACVRGLIDTDGSVFTHRYKVNGKWYAYKKLAFTSLSKPLAHSVHAILKALGLNPRLAQAKDVRLDSINDMKCYFQIVGSHNPKHLRRYRE